MRTSLSEKSALEIQKMNLGNLSDEERKEMDRKTEEFLNNLSKKSVAILRALKNQK